MTTSPQTPDPVSTPDTGTTVGDAASAIERLLARESGEPAATEEPEQPTAEAEQAEAQQPDDEAEETQAEAEQAEADAAEGEGAADDEDQPQQEPDAKTLVTVEIDGKAEQVSLEELKRSYLRTADYTRKTQALAAERKSLQSEVQALRTERQQYAQLLPALEQQLQTLMPKEPEWDRLLNDDPIEYVRQVELKRQRDDKLRAAQMEQQRLATLQSQEQARELQAKLAEEREALTQAIPAWKDSAKWAADRARIREYGAKLGWTDDELSAVTDHRAVTVLYKAMQFDEAMARRPSPAPAQKQAAPAPVRPGSQRTAPRPVSDLTRAKQRLAKTNSVRDAAAVLERLL